MRKVEFYERMFATFFMVGRIPLCPGTWGSLAGLFLFYLLRGFPVILISLFILFFFGGRYTSSRVARLLGEQDPSCVVIDEVAGIFVAFFFIPVMTPGILFTGFILFRLFDIFKPPPVRQLECLPDGWGIMLDDIAAGVYANLCLRLILTVGA